MKMIVTGGCGFIGSNFVKYITKRSRRREEGHQVSRVFDKCTYAADPKRIKPLKIPLSKLDIVKTPWWQVLEVEKPDVIVNFAAETHVDNSIKSADEFIHSNYVGLHKIICGIREYFSDYRKKVFLVHISTDEVYGDMPTQSTKRFQETDALSPNNPYSASKAAADLMLRAMYHTYRDFDYAICRASNNYGPHQHQEKFLPTIVKSVLSDKQIPVYGDGSNVREWLWVEDFAVGIERIIDIYANQQRRHSVVDQIFNFGTDDCRNNLDVVKTVLELMNASEDFISFVKDRPGHDRKYAVNWEKAKTILGWSPQKQFYDGVNDVIYDVASSMGKASLRKLDRLRQRKVAANDG
jgi:dTDP-glucose 4,6-dehydratase